MGKIIYWLENKTLYWCEKLFNFAKSKTKKPLKLLFIGVPMSWGKYEYMNFDSVSRLEVISRKDGRVFVKNRGVEIDGFSLQDNWRTLKIFIN